MFIHSNR